jgi:hypothetical protein
MNCQDFESVAFELARARLMDAAACEAATTHADSCGVCAERLRRERALTGALLEVGARTREARAPRRVEAALIAAFRESCGAVSAATVETARTGSATPFTARPRVTRRVIATAAVAASLLVALAAAWRAIAPKGSSRSSQSVALGVKQTRPSGGVDTAPKQIEPAPSKRVEVNRAGTRPVMTHDARRTTPRRTTAVESLPISFKVDGGQVISDEGESAAAQAADSAAAADFVQLATGDNSAPMESGQMVRVQVPRAALAALGLPVNAERAGELVKADILLAQDGTARAIRLRP